MAPANLLWAIGLTSLLLASAVSAPASLICSLNVCTAMPGCAATPLDVLASDPNVSTLLQLFRTYGVSCASPFLRRLQIEVSDVATA